MLPRPSPLPLSFYERCAVPVQPGKEDLHDQDRTLYSVRRFRLSGPGHREDRQRRLRPCGRDGRAVRAEYLHRHPGGEVHQTHHGPAAGRASDDRPPGAVRGSVLRRGRGHRDVPRGGGHRGEYSCGHPQDPRQGQEGRRGGEAQDPRQRRAALHRRGGADFGDDR